MDITTRPPEGVTLEEQNNTLKITCKPRGITMSQFSSFFLVDVFFILLILCKLEILHLEIFSKILTFPLFNSFPILLIMFALCSSTIGSSIILFRSSRVIEINDTSMLIYKPLPQLPPSNISLQDIDRVYYDYKPMGLKKMYFLKAILKNSTEVPIIGMAMVEEEQVKFIQSVIQERLGLKGAEG
jgi:hypothetical protein